MATTERGAMSNPGHPLLAETRERFEDIKRRKIELDDAHDEVQSWLEDLESRYRAGNPPPQDAFLVFRLLCPCEKRKTNNLKVLLEGCTLAYCVRIDSGW